MDLKFIHKTRRSSQKNGVERCKRDREKEKKRILPFLHLIAFNSDDDDDEIK